MPTTGTFTVTEQTPRDRLLSTVEQAAQALEDGCLSVCGSIATWQASSISRVSPSAVGLFSNAALHRARVGKSHALGGFAVVSAELSRS